MPLIMGIRMVRPAMDTATILAAAVAPCMLCVICGWALAGMSRRQAGGKEPQPAAAAAAGSALGCWA